MSNMSNANSPDSPDIYDKTGGSETKTETETEAEIKLFKNQIIMIEDALVKITLDRDPAIKYTGKFLHKNNSNNILTLGVCVNINQTFEYKENEVFSLLFIENKSLYNFDAKLLKIREANQSDGFETDDITSDINKYNKYILSVIPMTSPQKQQRREFFRMPLCIDVCYKIIDTKNVGGDLKKLRDLNKLKFDSGKAKETKKMADNGILEKEMGYFKLATSDLSAGGFKYRSKTNMNMTAGTFLDCLLIINDEALPAIAQILSSTPDGEYPELYEIRVLIHEISDPARDRVVKYIFAQERQANSGLFKVNN